jgi:hypothetical protein
VVAREVERDEIEREDEGEEHVDLPEQRDAAHPPSVGAPCYGGRGERGPEVAKLYEFSLWVFVALGRLRDALRTSWRRILAGAFMGWLFAVVGGAFALASLEFHGVVSRTTSDDLGIIIVLYGVGAGALFAYAIRPAARVPAD